MNNTAMELKNNVLTELKHEPIVKVIDISVLVQNGTATLK